MITTKGRLLDGFLLTFAEGEIQVSCVMLAEDERIAILIDGLNNNARLYAPLDLCRILASQHQYELVWPRERGESLRGWLALDNHHSAVSIQAGIAAR